MDVEHEAADRHRRIAAVVNHVVPVLVTQLGDVHPERDQHVERVAWRHGALGQRVAQADSLFLGIALAQQFRLEQIEITELLVGRERRMVGDIVGSPDEVVERQNQRAVPRMNDPRRDRKILVAVGLSRSQVARAGHQKLATFVWFGGMHRRAAHAMGSRPHIGEYAAKTNAIWAYRPCPSGLQTGRNRPAAGLTGIACAYWPWFFRTWSQAGEILGRFCCRQARMVKSP